MLVIFQNSALAAKEINVSQLQKTNLSILFKEIIAVYFENHTKLRNTVCGQNAGLLIIKADSRIHVVTTGL
jgi:hypothetical protein